MKHNKLPSYCWRAMAPAGNDYQTKDDFLTRLCPCNDNEILICKRQKICTARRNTDT